MRCWSLLAPEALGEVVSAKDSSDVVYAIKLLGPTNLPSKRNASKMNFPFVLPKFIKISFECSTEEF